MPLTLAGILLACGGASSSAPAATGSGDDTTANTSGPDATDPPAATAPPATAAGAAPAPTDAPTDAADDDAGVVVEVPDALRFTAPLVGGGEIELGTLAGRPVLLWFWAPW